MWKEKGAERIHSKTKNGKKIEKINMEKEQWESDWKRKGERGRQMERHEEIGIDTDKERK